MSIFDEKSLLSQLAIGSPRIPRISQAEKRFVSSTTGDDKCSRTAGWFAQAFLGFVFFSLADLRRRVAP